MRILFVCTGNSCRSVMAETLIRHVLEKAGVGSLDVSSAGVYAVQGMRATRETMQVLRACGIDAGGHRARRLTDEMIASSDLIFVMERFQGEEIVQRYPQVAEKVHLLKAYGVNPGEHIGDPNIPDPIGKPMEVYEVCFETIREAIGRVTRLLGVKNL